MKTIREMRTFYYILLLFYYEFSLVRLRLILCSRGNQKGKQRAFGYYCTIQVHSIARKKTIVVDGSDLTGSKIYL
jgi:hypothetical protein